MEPSQASPDPADADTAILIGLGANLPSSVGAPRDTLEAAVARFPEHGMTVVARSSWYLTTPVPFSSQPLFVNGVVRIWTDKTPEAVLETLLAIEASFGRVRSVANAARRLDLDLLAYGRLVVATERLTLPHPRMSERLFVLAPLAEMLPGWTHPQSGLSATALLAACRAAAGEDRVERI